MWQAGGRGRAVGRGGDLPPNTGLAAAFFYILSSISPLLPKPGLPWLTPCFLIVLHPRFATAVPAAMLPVFYPVTPESLPSPLGGPEIAKWRPERPGADDERPRKKRVITAARKEQNRIAQKAFSEFMSLITPAHLTDFFQGSDKRSVDNSRQGSQLDGNPSCVRARRSLG